MTTTSPLPSLDTLAAEIMAAHTAALTSSRVALDHARLAGDLLLQAKAQVKAQVQHHGAWLKWLAANCNNLSVRTVQSYMQIAREWSRVEEWRNTHPDTHFAISEARRVLANRKDEDNDDDEASDDDDGHADDHVSDDDMGSGGHGGHGRGGEQRQLIPLFFTVPEMAAVRADVNALAAHLGIATDNEPDRIRAVMACAHDALIRRRAA